MFKNEIEFSSLIILWESYFWELKLLLLPANTMTEVPTMRGGVSDPRAAPAVPQRSWAALLCWISGDQSSSHAQQALLFSDRLKGFWEWEETKWQLLDQRGPDLRIRLSGAIISTLNLVLCSSFLDVLGHQVNHSEQTSQIFCPHHLEQRFC